MTRLLRSNRIVRAVAIGVALLSLAGADTPTKISRDAAIEFLKPFDSVIGEWKGTGQPKRGSNAGAWLESANWVWDFSDDVTRLRCDTERGKLFQSMELRPNSADEFEIHVEAPDGRKTRFRGKRESKKLVATAEVASAGFEQRVTLTILSENRVLFLLEKKKPNQRRWARFAGIGYTRKGVSLAAKGNGQPECVVTGGLGTIRVEHAGRTYRVCCSGCKRAFEADPEGTVAAWRKRLKK